MYKCVTVYWTSNPLVLSRLVLFGLNFSWFNEKQRQQFFRLRIRMWFKLRKKEQIYFRFIWESNSETSVHFIVVFYWVIRAFKSTAIYVGTYKTSWTGFCSEQYYSNWIREFRNSNIPLISEMMKQRRQLDVSREWKIDWSEMFRSKWRTKWINYHERM